MPDSAIEYKLASLNARLAAIDPAYYLEYLPGQVRFNEDRDDLHFHSSAPLFFGEDSRLCASLCTFAAILDLMQKDPR